MLAFSDELRVPGRFLVQVVAGAVGEDDVQADVKPLVIDVAIQIGNAFAASEEYGAWVIDQILFATGNQLVPARLRLVGDGEKNVVG
jgi:hypothetical protein